MSRNEEPWYTEAVAPFDFRPRTRVVFGPGTVARAGELARELGATRVLLVSDQGVVAAGHAARVQESLRRSGLHVVEFFEVRENPTSREVDACLAVAQRERVDFLAGLGGGSAMDTAKGCNFILTNGGAMKDYWGVGKATRPMLPLLAIPTTAGTGSECQCAALIADPETHQKMACLDPKAAARVAILDPELTLSQPPRVSACTGLDALAHAVETAVTTQRNPISALHSRESFRLCHRAFPRVLRQPDHLAARGAMLLGAAHAGLAIENSMLGAAHAGANPLTAHAGLAHGHAVGLLLPQVVRFNLAVPAARAHYQELAESAGGALQAEDLPAELERLLAGTGMPARLRDCGIANTQIATLAEEAARQWTARFNPRPLTAADFAQLYQQVW